MYSFENRVNTIRGDAYLVRGLPVVGEYFKVFDTVLDVKGLRDLSLEEQLTLALHESLLLRESFAANPHIKTSLHIQKIQVRDEYYVRLHLAENPNTMPEIMEILSKDAEPYIRLKSNTHSLT